MEDFKTLSSGNRMVCWTAVYHIIMFQRNFKFCFNFSTGKVYLECFNDEWQ